MMNFVVEHPLNKSLDVRQIIGDIGIEGPLFVADAIVVANWLVREGHANHPLVATAPDLLAAWEDAAKRHETVMWAPSNEIGASLRKIAHMDN